MQNAALDALLRFLYPPACPACREPHADDLLCAACAGAVAAAQGLRVPDPLAAFDVVVACRYASVVRDLILALKFGHDPHPARALGGLLAQAVAEAPAATRVDAIIPVPLSRRRARSRGFNQAALIARAAADAVGAPLLPGLLKRPVYRRPQADLGPEERATNVRAVFRAADGVFGRAVLLVDDVITTGHTMAEAARTLLSGGARRVVCAAVAASGWAQK